MVAEAIQIANPHYKRVLVDLQTIRWTNPRTKKRYVAQTPPIVGLAIVAFDRGEPVEPFSFVLKPYQRTDAYGHGPVGAKKGPSMESQLVIYKEGGEHLIEGGRPLPTGHLPGTAVGVTHPGSAKRVKRRAAKTRDEIQKLGNVVISSTTYRQYGLRLLKD